MPGSNLTLGNNNGATTSTFEKMVDHYLEAMGIKDLELVERTESKRPNLYPFGPLRVAWMANPKAVYLLSSCPLTTGGDTPCRDIPDRAPTRVFVQDLRDGRVRAARRAPENSVPSPDGARLAWRQGGSVCVARAGQLDAARCTAAARPSDDP